MAWRAQRIATYITLYTSSCTIYRYNILLYTWHTGVSLRLSRDSRLKIICLPGPWTRGRYGQSGFLPPPTPVTPAAVRVPAMYARSIKRPVKLNVNTDSAIKFPALTRYPNTRAYTYQTTRTRNLIRSPARSD